MPALSFAKQFAAMVESGEKTQTIRAHRKRPFKCGDTLYLYTGMRTKACRKLGEGLCREVENIEILVEEIMRDSDSGEEALSATRERIAVDDGFSDWSEMVDWFKNTHGLPFEGQLIRWELVQ